MSEETPPRFRSPAELSPEERAEFERWLDSGVAELPPNEPRGMLGEHGMDIRKVDDHAPDLNAGLLQENDGGVWGLAIVLAFLIFFPLGYVMLWRDKRLSRRRKIATSLVVAVIIGLVAVKLMNG